MITEQDVPCAHRTKGIVEGLYACTIHGVCSLDRVYPTIRPCIGCSNRSEPLPSNPNVHCIHRGRELERIGCPTCTGTVEVKIYECTTVFKKCQIGIKLPHIHSCHGCPLGVEPC